MKQTDSLVPGGRPQPKRADTTARAKVSHVRFTDEEMAYNAPADVSDPEKFPKVARGQDEWNQYRTFKRGYAKLDSDVRAFYSNDQSVNDVLRKAMELMTLKPTTAKPRKSA